MVSLQQAIYLKLQLHFTKILSQLSLEKLKKTNYFWNDNFQGLSNKKYFYLIVCDVLLLMPSLKHNS